MALLPTVLGPSGFRAYLQPKSFDFSKKRCLAIFAPNGSGQIQRHRCAGIHVLQRRNAATMVHAQLVTAAGVDWLSEMDVELKADLAAYGSRH
ncbi:hypothetical protein X766_26300 [Mesorhizobium sp. LSJC255A00]|nr:hypothetical protein X766_26300 [Mesorhizobium sp. LSJC255A00]